MVYTFFYFILLSILLLRLFAINIPIIMTKITLNIDTTLENGYKRYTFAYIVIVYRISIGSH